MSNISKLAVEAARQQYSTSMEKEAFIGKALLGAGKHFRKLFSGARRHKWTTPTTTRASASAAPVSTRVPTSSAPGLPLPPPVLPAPSVPGATGRSLLGTLGRAGLFGVGAAGAKDLATLPFGGWKNTGDFGGMRKGGLNYQRQAINPANVGALQAAMNILGSPVKSLASLPFGDPNASPVGYPEGQTSTSSLGVKRVTYAPQAVGPLAARRQREWQEAKDEYAALRGDKKSELEKARARHESGDYPDAAGGVFSDPYEDNEAGRRMVEKAMSSAEIARLENQLRSGQYGGTWWNPWSDSAADLQKTISDRRKYLSRLGLGSRYGGSTGSEWGSPSATRRRELQLRELGY